MRKVLAATVMMIAALVHQSQTVRAANIDVDVDINMPSILILYCYSNVDVTISAAALAELLLGVVSTGDDTVTDAGPGVITATVNGSNELEGTDSSLTTTITTGVNPASVNLNMNDICAFRAIGAGSGVQVSAVVSAPVGSDTFTHATNASSTITINGVNVRSSTNGSATFGATDTVTTGLGLGNVNDIDVQLDLDLSNVIESGFHNDASVQVTAAVL